VGRAIQPLRIGTDLGMDSAAFSRASRILLDIGTLRVLLSIPSIQEALPASIFIAWQYASGAKSSMISVAQVSSSGLHRVSSPVSMSGQFMSRLRLPSVLTCTLSSPHAGPRGMARRLWRI
jgi:hypothetical protein